MDAITFPPAPINEPNLTYAPGSPEREAPAGRAREARATREGPQGAHRRPPQGGWRCRDDGRAAARPPARAGPVQGRDPGRRARGDQGRRRGRSRLAGARHGRAVRRPAPGGRPAGRTVAAADQRRHHARPVEDGVPGRDRQRLRADRLLALQRPLRQADPHRPADREQPRDLEPHRPPAARGLRLRDHAVQLHRDRRQPADRAGADGQHRHLEAGADPAARRVADSWSCSRRPDCRRA